MKIGVNVESRRPWTTAETIKSIGVRAEQWGYDSLWVSDHVVIPTGIESKYPFGSGNVFTPEQSQNYFEAITVLAFLAGATTRPQLGVSVLVVPQRQPLLVAKQWATLDALSGGRAILGVGAGWMQEEFEALGVATFERRGKALDEAIAIYRQLWGVPEPSGFEGEVYSFPQIAFGPKTVAGGRSPIWIGGHGRRSLRRAAELGDGWLGTRLSLEDYAACRDTIHEFLGRYGRQTSEVVLSNSLQPWAPGTGPEGGEHDCDLVGPPERQAEKIRKFQALGVEHVVLQPQPRTSSAPVMEALERFASEVRPLLAN